MGVLRRLLADVVESDARAEQLLEAAGASAVAIAAPAVVAFAHERLARLLAPELGPRAVLALLTQLDDEVSAAASSMDGDAAATARAHGLRVTSDILPRAFAPLPPYTPPATTPPSSHIIRSRRKLAGRPRVAILDEDRYRRATLAQRLASSACDVSVAASLAELEAMLDGPGALHAVLVDEAHPWLALVVRAVADSEPRATLVVMAEDGAVAHRALVAARAREYHLHIKDDPAAELIDLLRSFVDA